MYAFNMQLRKRIALILVILLLLMFVIIHVHQLVVNSNEQDDIYMQKNYLSALSHWYNYSDSGEI
jgi:hypothetical protein